MKSSIFEYRDYKKLVIDLIEGDPNRGRGKRKHLADSIGCQVSHITSVLSGDAHFNQEQAYATAVFFGFAPQETEFFLLLVQHNRAATVSLKKFFEKVIEERAEKNMSLKARLKMPDSLGAQEEARYYESWQFGAVHVLLSIPQFQSREAVAKKLGLSLPRVDEILNFLVETGLCQKDGHSYKIVRGQLHLDKSSPLISKHHVNWRLRSLFSLDQKDDSQLHYSSVFSLAPKDYARVREILSKALSQSLDVITRSPEEEIAAVCLDLFRL